MHEDGEEACRQHEVNKTGVFWKLINGKITYLLQFVKRLKTDHDNTGNIHLVAAAACFDSASEEDRKERGEESEAEEGGAHEQQQAVVRLPVGRVEFLEGGLLGQWKYYNVHSHKILTQTLKKLSICSPFLYSC